MSDPPEGEIFPQTGEILARAKLPLPIRGTRYLVGGVLLAVILTVVTTTYLRIERQLQETLDVRLAAVLAQNLRATHHALERRELLAQKAAELPTIIKTAEGLASGDISSEEARITLSAGVLPLLRTGMADSVTLLRPNGKLLVQAGKSEGFAPHPRPHTAERLFEFGSGVQVERGATSGRVVAFALVGPRPNPTALLALSLSQVDETSLLLPFSDTATIPGAELTYAFDERGALYKSLSSGSPERASPMPPGARLALQSKQPRPGTRRTSVLGPTTVERYTGLSGKPVAGAWAFNERYQVGVVTEISQDEALGSIARLRQSFLVLVILVGAAVLGFIALGRWTLRVREESVLMTRRLGRLARAIQPLSAALEHDPSAVVLVDGDGQVVYANAASHRVLGVSAPLLGRDVDKIFENLPAELQTALMIGQDSIVAQGTDTDDETLLVSSRNLTIDGNPHFLYMLRPVTQQVRRQEVEHWKKLIRVLSHELNNALAPITSLLSSARKVNQMTHQDPRLGNIFESIAERTRHLISFIEGYREVARLPRPDQREVNWHLFLTSLASQKRFIQTGEIPDKLGYFDPIQLERVLVNVINNSYEAESPPEHVQLEVLEEPLGFRLNVKDRGTGMPEPVLKQAMLPFFSTKRTGTGVGLALSREIIEAHGGQLTLANREGGGLVVSCFLPHALQPSSRASMSRLAVSPLVAASTGEEDIPT